MRETSLDAILENFDPTEQVSGGAQRGTTLTIWVTPELKNRYDQLQKASKRRFAKKLREIIQAAIEATEDRIA